MKLKLITTDKLIKAEISTNFLERISGSFQYVLSIYGIENFQEFLLKYKDSKDSTFCKDELEHALYTLFTLVLYLETKAQEQGFVEEKELSNESLSQQYPQSE